MKYILIDIINERMRQRHMHGDQNLNPVEWVSILTEEVGEAAQRANQVHFKENGNPDKSLLEFRTELIQVAAVAVQIIENLDKKNV